MKVTKSIKCLNGVCTMDIFREGIIVVSTFFNEDIIKEVEGRCWYPDKDGYVVSTKRNGPTLRLHRVVLGAKSGQECDHIDRNRLNNLRSNLRIVSHQENCTNRTQTGDGVGWRKDKKRWRARVKSKGKETHIGHFLSEKEALEARNKYLLINNYQILG